MTRHQFACGIAIQDCSTKHTNALIQSDVIEARKLHLLAKHGVDCDERCTEWIHNLRCWWSHERSLAQQSETYKRVYADILDKYQIENTTQNAVRALLRNECFQREMNETLSSIDYWSVHKHYCDDT